MKYLFLTLFMVIFVSCGNYDPGPDQHFSDYGLTFDFAGDWSITEQEVFDGGFYLSCERKGMKSSGLVTISYIGFIMEEIDMISLIQNEMKSNPLYQSSDLIFVNQMDTLFNGYRCLQSDYEVGVMGIPHRGSIYCFITCEKTFSVLFQEAIEDEDVNSYGFDKVRYSFKCIEPLKTEADSTYSIDTTFVQ